MSDPLWISASEALEMLQPFFGGRRATKEMLADLLRDGKLRARAERKWRSKQSGARFKVPHKDSFEIECGLQIPPKLWRLSRQWSADQERWRWPRGDFLISCGAARTEYVFLKDVHFNREEVFASHRRGKEFTESLKKRGGGVKTPADKWAIITEAVLRLERTGRLTKNEFGTAESLAHEIESNPDIGPVLGRTVLEKFCGHIVRNCLR